MDLESFFSSQRWKVLELLARNPSSPLEISKYLNTSVAYVSQQLKLLEAAGFIVKHRTKAVQKGQPRTVFTIAKEMIYLTFLSKSGAGKKAIDLNEHNKSILKIWMIEDSSVHYFLEKFYWRIEEELSNVKAIYFDNEKNRVTVFSDSKKVKMKSELFSKEIDCKIAFSVLSEKELEKFPKDKIIMIYENIIKELKGGVKIYE
jgi:predicted transcriptional regulator